MPFKPFELKIADLPSTFEIEMPQDSIESDVEGMLESVRSHVIYNSRSTDEDFSTLDLQVRVLERRGHVVKLHVAAG